MNEHYDFCGYATKNDLLCADGRTIRKDAFKGCDGVTVPLVWNHRHDDPDMVLGHALLQNRPDGVYMYGKFNDTEKAQTCKKILANKDVKGLSIWANQLKQQAGNVLHGVIREVSLVLAGANPGAMIDLALSHADGSDGEVYAYLVGEEFTELKHGDVEFETYTPEEELVTPVVPVPAFSEANDQVLAHADEKKEKEEKEEEQPKEESEDKPKEKENKEDMAKEDTKEKAPQKEEKEGKTVEEIFNTLTDEQKDAVYVMLAAAAGMDNEDEEDDEEEDMKHNVFDAGYERQDYISHADMETIFSDAKKMGSLKDAVEHHIEDGVLAHTISGPDDYGVSRGVAPVSGDKYGMYDPELFFPEYRSIDPTPQWVKRETDWVDEFIGAVRHTPFSRIKTLMADITESDARALGYIKGNLKKEEFFTLMKRTTDPQTIYKKQKMDRDDIIDITDFDVVAWIKSEMRIMLNEEIARAALIGDGRSSSADDKISESHVRPISSDSELFSVKVAVQAGSTDDATAKAFIKAAIKARKDYKGSGNPVLYCTEDVLADLLLIEDGIGHLLYANEAQLCTALRVRKVVAVPVMENATVPITSGSTTTARDLMGIIVNPVDYTIGADKGGAINMFDDFDIDYNQQKYLIETRISGALVKPHSALVLYKVPASSNP